MRIVCVGSLCWAAIHIHPFTRCPQKYRTWLIIQQLHNPPINLHLIFEKSYLACVAAVRNRPKIKPRSKEGIARSLSYMKHRLIYTLQTKPTIFQSTAVAQRFRYSLRGLRQIFLWPSCISFLVQRWEESLRVWGSETKPSFPRRRLCSAPTASCAAPHRGPEQPKM